MDLLVKAFVEKQRGLIELEYQEQLACQAEYLTKLSKQQLQRKGVALLNLRESSRATGLAGKLIIEYVGGYENALPSHQIKVGDVVKIEKGSVDKTVDVSGIVCSVRTGSISVSFKGEYPEDWKDGLRLVKLANDVSFKRLRYALDKLIELPKLGSHNRLLETIFDKNLKIPDDSGPDWNLTFYNDRLNDIQKEATRKAIWLDPCALIHGPPGTGKSETIVEVIKQLVRPTVKGRASKKVLVCAPSNLAVDNLVERLAKDERLSMVRLGHPARMLPGVQEHSLDYKLVHGDQGSLVKDIRKEIDQLIGSLAKKGQAKREIYSNLKDLRRELKERESKALSTIFQSTQIILCTLNMAGSKQLNGQHFDVVVIDESSQALEAECWLGMLLADKVIFAGDHQQLPPTVTSEEAAKKGLAQTVFEKLMKRHGETISSLLQIQYRMHQDIMRWASEAMYEGKLIAHESVAGHTLGDLAKALADFDPIVFVDTAGLDMTEGVTEDSDVESRFNEGEAKIAMDHIKELIEGGLAPAQCAIISPYNGQVDLLKSMAESCPELAGVEIGTVDSFQGREKEAIVISFVRSNADGEIGFLSDIRRTNVAVTRARRHVYMIGDSATLGRHAFYKNLIGYVEEHGVMDYPVI